MGLLLDEDRLPVQRASPFLISSWAAAGEAAMIRTANTIFPSRKTY